MTLSPMAMSLIIQGIRAGITAFEEGEKGEKSEEVIMTEYTDMQSSIKAASSKWWDRGSAG